MSQRIIAHFDLDSFFVSVEILHNPALKGLRTQMAGWFSEHGVPEFDGAALPVAGAGQHHPLGFPAGHADSLGAFTGPNWDGVRPPQRRP